MAIASKTRLKGRIGKISIVERVLIFIKHHLGFLWRILEWANGILFSLLFRSRMLKVLPGVFDEFSEAPYSYERLNKADAMKLYDLIHSQDAPDLTHFSPHGFDPNSIRKQLLKPAFQMMGVFDGEKLVGYFFLRFFVNRKCFVGRIIDKTYRGKGIGEVMNNIMYETAWRMGFRCLSTISRKNKAVLGAHAKNRAMVLLKELSNEYILVEFVNRKEII